MPEGSRRGDLRFAVVAVTTAGVDQGSKWLALRIAPGVAHRNSGVTDGLWRGSPLLWTLVSVTAVVLAVVWRSVRRGWAQLAVGMLVGGIIGNLVDRMVRGPLMRGSVVDWLRLPHLPETNIADVAIRLGALVVIVAVLGRGLAGRRRLHGR